MTGCAIEYRLGTDRSLHYPRCEPFSEQFNNLFLKALMTDLRPEQLEARVIKLEHHGALQRLAAGAICAMIIAAIVAYSRAEGASAPRITADSSADLPSIIQAGAALISLVIAS